MCALEAIFGGGLKGRVLGCRRCAGVKKNARHVFMLRIHGLLFGRATGLCCGRRLVCDDGAAYEDEG